MELKRGLWLGVGELGMAFAGLVAGYLVVGTAFSPFDAGAATLVQSPLIVFVAAAFYGFVGPRWAAAARDEGDSDDGPVESAVVWLSGVTSAWGAAAVAAVGIAAVLLGSLVLGLVLDGLGFGVQEQARVVQIADGVRSGVPPTEAIALAISALLMAPLAEELLFRRLLFSRLVATSGRPLAYGFSALAFAAVHGNPAGLLIYVWQAVVFAAVFERTGGRLWTAVVVHLANNAYVLSALFFGPG